MKSPMKHLARDEAPTFVYVMQDGSRTKIGIAADPMKRKRQIIGATGLDIVLRSYRQFSTRLSAVSVERQLHRTFNRWRGAGEWFDVSADKAVAAMQAATDPELHHRDWRHGMPPEALASAVERFRWNRAARLGVPYEPYDALKLNKETAGL